MNNNVNCESCHRVICECKQIVTEQEAIERLQEMPVAEAVRELWNHPDDYDADTIAELLGIDAMEVWEELNA